MWRELKLTDEDLDTQLQKICDWASTMNDYYAENFNVEKLRVNFVNKQPYHIKIFILEGENEVAMTTKVDQNDEVLIANVAVGNYTTVNEVAGIIDRQVAEIMGIYEKNIVYAIWQDGNTEKGQAIFDRATSDESLRENGMYGAFTINEETRKITYSIK